MLLVTGITGHSGKHFLKELIDHQYHQPIRCIVRENSDTTSIDHSGLTIEKVVGDLNDPVFMDQAMIGITQVLHIGSIFYSVSVIKAAVKNDVKKAILVHTTGIYSKYKSASEEYKEIESEIEQITRESNKSIDIIYLRPTMIYGYWNDRNMIVFIKMVHKLRVFPVINNGKSLLQPVNGKDLGKAYYDVLMNNQIVSGDYILSGEKPVSMLELFKMISDYLGKRTIFISVPLGLAVFMAKTLKLLTFNKIDFIERVQRMGENRDFSHEKARNDFGYRPMPLSQGLKLEIEDFLNRMK